jgi:hypothetical protein
MAGVIVSFTREGGQPSELSSAKLGAFERLFSVTRGASIFVGVSLLERRRSTATTETVSAGQ